MISDRSEQLCGMAIKKITIIIGILQSILSFITCVLCAAYTEHPHELIEMSSPSTLPDVLTLKTVLVFLSVVSGLQCLFSILVIFGAVTNRSVLLIPWLILNPITLAVYILGTITGVIRQSNDASFILVHLAIACITCFFSVYNIYVIRSHYKNLRKLNF